MKILVVQARGSAEDYALLHAAGHEVVLAGALTESELLEHCQDVHGIIAMRLSGEVMAGAPLLRAVVAPVIGSDKVDVESASNLGILVCNSPTPENFVSVSEAAIGMMVALFKRMKRKEARLRSGEWGAVADRGFLLWKKTIGLIGLGRTGAGVARRLAGWDVRVLAHDPYLSEEQAREVGATLVDLPTLLQESDAVSLHVVITPETLQMIGEEQLRRMKPTAYLVNTSRGEAIDEVALARAITEEWIAGAALDTYEQEPLSADSPLRALDPERVILTPHNIAHTMASLEANRALAIQSMISALRGEVPETAVNKEIAPDWRRRFTDVRSV
jgi:D-3-phosphoglycerate dehydrogenase